MLFPSARQTRAVMGALMAAFYLAAGVLHLAAPEKFLPIVPGFVPWPREVVLATGICEIAGAAGLMLERFRWAAGLALAVYAAMVFPANIKHAVYMIPVEGLPSSWWYHAPRLALQPVIAWWALYCGGVTDWPFAAKR